MGNKNKTTTNSQQQQTVAPPSFTAPGLVDVSAQVTNAAKGLSGITPYAGEQIALPNQQLVQQQIDNYQATGQNAARLSGFISDRLNAAADPRFSTTLPGFNYDVGRATDTLNPAIESAIHPVFRQLTENILPSIRSSSLDSGAYSGSRATSVLPTQAIRESNENAQRIAATLGFEDYQQREARRLAAYQSDQQAQLQGFGLDTSRQLGAGDLITQRLQQLPGLTDAILRLQSSQGDLAGQAAAVDVNARQAGINNELSKDAFATSRPFAGLDIASQLLAQLSGNYGTTNGTSSSTSVQKTSGLGSIVQGAVGLGGLALGAPGLGSVFGGRGAPQAAAPIINASNLFRPSTFNPNSYVGG
jgi:hypothetical protein